MIATKSLTDWLEEYIPSLHRQVMELGLERIQAVADEMHCHTFSCPVIMVAGTNGKGSCVNFLENIYRAAGYQVGAYTSPHLLHFNERIRINGIEVSDDVLINAFNAIDQARRERPLSFFEFTTLAALWIFQQYPLDVLILEVGLGGRLDAVNIVDSDVAVITTIDIDHTDWLGSDRESIGHEKAGIFRANKPIVCGDPHPPQTLLKMAHELQSPFYCIEQAFEARENELTVDTWSWKNKTKSYQDLPGLSLKQQNAATSLMAIELLQEKLPVSAEQISFGLAQAKLPGRFEIFQSPVQCILDVAHNPQSAIHLAEQWKKIPVSGIRIAVVAMLSDKDIMGTITPLISCIDEWYVAGLPVERGANGEMLATILAAQDVKNCYHFTHIEDALEAAVQRAGVNSTTNHLLVFGSFYTVAAAKRYFK